MENAVPIIQLRPGDIARISSLVSGNRKHIQKLTVFGFLPGAQVEVLQISPAFVFRVENTQLAVDDQIAKIIWVKA